MSMFPIATTGTMTGSLGQVFFNNIPSNFTHLQLRVYGRGNLSTTAWQTSGVQFNLDGTGGNYNGHEMWANGSNQGTTSAGFFNAWFNSPYMPGNNSLANTFGIQIIDILDYTNTNKFKTIRAIGGFDDNNTSTTNQRIGVYSGQYRSTNAITSITYNVAGNTFIAGSRVDLYGIAVSNATGV